MPESDVGPIQYLKKELNFKVTEWSTLTDKDKADLKKWASDEMKLLKK